MSSKRSSSAVVLDERGDTVQPALILFGGFLGSGKTTLMVELGRRLSADGATVAVITNDQGEDLVDTKFAAASGIVASEVGSGCFCCNFSTFVENITTILKERRPDYILAEPVGSCTDLVATVLHPLSLFHADLVMLAGYYVLVDAPRILGEYRGLNLINPITPREVLISHQLQEAPRVLLSKCDLIAGHELEEATGWIAGLSRAPVDAVSVADGASLGLEPLVAEITARKPIPLPDPVDVDYELYAAAEAEMGWYNGVATLRSAEGCFADEFATAVLLRIDRLTGVETLHAKALVNTEAGSVKASLVGGAIRADSVIAEPAPAQQLGLTLNVRAVMDKDELGRELSRIVEETAGELGLELADYRYTSLIPGRPVPEHRITGS